MPCKTAMISGNYLARWPCYTFVWLFMSAETAQSMVGTLSVSLFLLYPCICNMQHIFKMLRHKILYEINDTHLNMHLVSNYLIHTFHGETKSCIPKLFSHLCCSFHGIWLHATKKLNGSSLFFITICVVCSPEGLKTIYGSAWRKLQSTCLLLNI